jgi:N-acyl-D-aspartate/D-glutamate deacylase
MEVLERAASSDAGRLVPQIACRPIVQRTDVLDPFLLRIFAPAFNEAYGLDTRERPALYRDRAWRDRALADVRRAERLDGAVVVESVAHTALIGGPTLGELARQRGTTALDVLLDLADEDRFRTHFEITLQNDDEDEVAEYLADDRGLLSLGEAGAHQSQICDAVYPSHLLGHWVRDRGALPLEHAIWHLTSRPADLFGLHDRGRIAPGLVADLVAFDPATVGPGPLERHHDLPGGADRLLAPSRGIEHVWVAGTAIRRAGAPVEGALPGTLLRSAAG